MVFLIPVSRTAVILLHSPSRPLGKGSLFTSMGTKYFCERIPPNCYNKVALLVKIVLALYLSMIKIAFSAVHSSHHIVFIIEPILYLQHIVMVDLDEAVLAGLCSGGSQATEGL